MGSNPIICCFVTHWGSTTHGMRRPQHKKTVRTYRPLERGVQLAYTMYVDHRWTIEELCATLGISRATGYRYVALARRAVSEG